MCIYIYIYVFIYIYICICMCRLLIAVVVADRHDVDLVRPVHRSGSRPREPVVAWRSHLSLSLCLSLSLYIYIYIYIYICIYVYMYISTCVYIYIYIYIYVYIYIYTRELYAGAMYRGSLVGLLGLSGPPEARLPGNGCATDVDPGDVKTWLE